MTAPAGDPRDPLGLAADAPLLAVYLRALDDWIVEPDAAVDPRTAFFGDAETVPAAAAVQRTCAELVAPYPPGVPVPRPGGQVGVRAEER